MRPTFRLALFSLAVVVAGCGPDKHQIAADSVRQHVDSISADSVARAKQDSINRTLPGYVIDSALPPAEELRRFRASLPGKPATAFGGGSESQEALVRRFVVALSHGDTNDLRAMVVHAREFADLYYPESPVSHRPFYQPPAFAWSLQENPSSKGLTELLKKLGGKPIAFMDFKCEPKVLHEGRTTRYTGCLTRIVGPTGDTAWRRMFGSIVERGGQYKFLSYTNHL